MSPKLLTPGWRLAECPVPLADAPIEDFKLCAFEHCPPAWDLLLRIALEKLSIADAVLGLAKALEFEQDYGDCFQKLTFRVLKNRGL